MAESLSCSLTTFSDHKCDISPRYPGIKEYFPVTSFPKDVRSHLRQVKVSHTTVSTEKDLILAQDGLFGDDGATSTIRPRHRAELGLMWRTSRKNKPEREAGLNMSKYIMEKWNVLVPVGTGRAIINLLSRNEG